MLIPLIINGVMAYYAADKLGEVIGPAALSATDQASDIEAIQDFFTRTTPSTEAAQKVKDEWQAFYVNLTWYDKNIDKNEQARAFNFRNAFLRANTPKEGQEKLQEWLTSGPARDPVTGEARVLNEKGDWALKKEPLIKPAYLIIGGITLAVGAVAAIAYKTVSKFNPLLP